MLNRRSIRFKPPRGSRKLSREVFRFRTLSRRCPIRFRTRYQQNTTVHKKQQQLLRPCTVQQAGRPNQWKTRFRVLSRRSIRFKSHKYSCKLSRGTSRVRTLNQSSPILFRPQRHPNTTVYKKQHQLLRSKRTEWPCKLNPGAFRFRTLSRRCSIRFRKHVPHVNAMIEHSSIKDCTRYSQTAILHHHSPGNTGDWSQKSAKEEALRNHHGLTTINHKLSDALHSTGAQIQIQQQYR